MKIRRVEVSHIEVAFNAAHHCHRLDAIVFVAVRLRGFNWPLISVRRICADVFLFYCMCLTGISITPCSFTASQAFGLRWLEEL